MAIFREIYHVFFTLSRQGDAHLVIFGVWRTCFKGPSGDLWVLVRIEILSSFKVFSYKHIYKIFKTLCTYNKGLFLLNPEREK